MLLNPSWLRDVTYLYYSLYHKCGLLKIKLSPYYLTELYLIKVILGKYFTNYSDALKNLNLDSLENRRKKLNLNFAKKCLKLDNMCTLFPVKKSLHIMRKSNVFKYKINKAKTYRYKISSIPHMQNLLNENFRKQNNLLYNVKSHCKIVNCDLCTHT